MDQLMKNIETATVLPFASLVDYAPGQVASKTLAQIDAVSLTLFAFAKGEEISTHESHGDALVIALDGIGEITIDGEKHPLRAGEAILMPARHPHAVYAVEKFKMFLAVVFPSKPEGE